MGAEYVEVDHQWEGKAAAKLEKATPEKVWPLLEDFYNIHKWLPNIDTCHKVEGQPDLVRYCSATLGDGKEMIVRWCHEKLLEMDSVNKCLSYEVADNNLGFKSYKSTVKVNEIEGDGCLIEWSFLADPVEGLSYEDLVAYLHLSIQGMAQNMEEALGSAQLM